MSSDPDRLRAARERGQLRRRTTVRRSPAFAQRGQRLALAITMYRDGFLLHDIRRITGLVPSVVSELAAWAGLPRRRRGPPRAAASAQQPSVAGVLAALDGTVESLVEVAERLGVDLSVVVAIHHWDGGTDPDGPGGEPVGVAHRCPVCLAIYRGDVCPHGCPPT